MVVLAEEVYPPGGVVIGEFGEGVGHTGQYRPMRPLTR
jgi:hypothetical protein